MVWIAGNGLENRTATLFGGCLGNKSFYEPLNDHIPHRPSTWPCCGLIGRLWCSCIQLITIQRSPMRPLAIDPIRQILSCDQLWFGIGGLLQCSHLAEHRLHRSQGRPPCVEHRQENARAHPSPRRYVHNMQYILSCTNLHKRGHFLVGKRTAHGLILLLLVVQSDACCNVSDEQISYNQ